MPIDVTHSGMAVNFPQLAAWRSRHAAKRRPVDQKVNLWVNQKVNPGVNQKVALKVDPKVQTAAPDPAIIPSPGPAHLPFLLVHRLRSICPLPMREAALSLCLLCDSAVNY